MTYPYGKREKVKLVWEDSSHSSKVKLTKASVVFQGSKKHCAEEAIRWLYKKDFIDPVNVAWLAMKLDIKLYGKFSKMFSDQKSLVSEPVKKPVLIQNI